MQQREREARERLHAIEAARRLQQEVRCGGRTRDETRKKEIGFGMTQMTQRCYLC